MLSLTQIEKAIGDSDAFNRGLQYYHDDALETLEIEYRNSSSIALKSKVFDSDLYAQTVSIHHYNNHTIITGECDCPVGFNCKHVAVIAFANTEEQGKIHKIWIHRQSLNCGRIIFKN